MLISSRWTLFSAVSILISGSAYSQGLPKAPKAEVSTVTPKPGFFTEPSIAVNPANPRQVVAAFRDNAHIAYSTDVGRHWQLANGIEPPNYRVSGDVSVTYDNEGRAYICYIALTSWALLIIGVITRRATAFTFAVRWTQAQSGNHRMSPRLSSQMNPQFRGKTSPISSPIQGTDLMRETFTSGGHDGRWLTLNFYSFAPRITAGLGPSP